MATIYEYQNYTKTPEDAVAAVLKAGTFSHFHDPFHFKVLLGLLERKENTEEKSQFLPCIILGKFKVSIYRS